MKLSLCMAIVFPTVAFLAPASSDAQWLNYKTPGIPRLPDGKPNLSAPAPKTAEGKPDLTGLWRDDTSATAAMSKAMDTLKPLPWAAALYEKRKDNLGSDSPGAMCLPDGPQIGAGVGKNAAEVRDHRSAVEGLRRGKRLQGRQPFADPMPVPSVDFFLRMAEPAKDWNAAGSIFRL